MKYCHNCHRITVGEPLFCSFCGRTYEVKLCPRLHPNPRTADVCSQCGSRDLSTPEPHSSFWTHFLERLVHVLPGIFLLLISVMFFAAFLQAFLTNPAVQGQFLTVGLLLALLWWLYVKLPRFVQRTIRKGIHRLTGRSGGHDEHHH